MGYEPIMPTSCRRSNRRPLLLKAISSSDCERKRMNWRSCAPSCRWPLLVDACSRTEPRILHLCRRWRYSWQRLNSESWHSSRT